MRTDGKIERLSAMLADGIGAAAKKDFGTSRWQLWYQATRLARVCGRAEEHSRRVGTYHLNPRRNDPARPMPASALAWRTGGDDDSLNFPRTRCYPLSRGCALKAQIVGPLSGATRCRPSSTTNAASTGAHGRSSTSTRRFNQTPVVMAPDFADIHNQNIAASSLFSITMATTTLHKVSPGIPTDPRAGIGAASALFSVSDGENDTITEYQFWDLTSDPASGHWVVNGFAQGANQAIDVTAAQLAQLLVRSSWPMASRPWGRW
jgi:hypothetical protein